MRFLIVLLFLFRPMAFAQETLDGPSHVFHDDLLDHLQGHWKAVGSIHGQPAEVQVSAEWVLNHQFLKLHEKSSSYEADIYVGFDNASERYVVHWIDVFGGRSSETLGYGTRSGDSVRLVFEYPDGPFHNTLFWKPETKSWRFLLETKTSRGEWKTFADQAVTKVE